MSIESSARTGGKSMDVREDDEPPATVLHYFARGTQREVVAKIVQVCRLMHSLGYGQYIRALYLGIGGHTGHDRRRATINIVVDGVPMPAWHLDVIRQRIAAADANPGASISLEILCAELMRRRDDTQTPADEQ